MPGEITVTIEEMKKFMGLYEEMKAQAGDTGLLDKMKGSFRGMDSIMSSWSKGVAGGAAAIVGFMSEIDKIKLDGFVNKLTDMKDKLLDSADQAGLTSGKLKGAAVEITALIAAATGRLEITSELKTLASTADGTSAQIGGMIDTLAKAFPELTAVLPADAIKNVFDQVDIAKKMETSLLMNAASAGQLDVALESVGNKMSNLSDMTLDFTALTAEVGTANNLTASQVSNYAAQLMKVPGSLGDVIKASSDGQTQMSMLDATIKVAAGTFQPFETVMKDVTMLFENWNKKGKDSIDFVSKMSSAAQSLKMPMDIMRDYVKGVGEQFKFLGDNTMGAIDIMSRVAPAFEASKLGPKAVAELVGKMTGAVSGMDMAQRAFVSAQTGGPGGLQGSFQIQQQMAEGDTVGVMSKVEDTMKQMFGGPMVTLKDAAQDQRSAAQYAKQVQMMTSGPLKLAENEQQAKAMIDAMAEGKMFDAAELGKGAEDPTQQAIDRGNEIQDRQFNEMVAMNNELERQTALAREILYSRTRQIIGPGTDADQGRVVSRSRMVRGEGTAEARKRKFQQERPNTRYGAGVGGEKLRTIDKAESLLERGADMGRKFGGFMGMGAPQKNEIFEEEGPDRRKIPGGAGIEYPEGLSNQDIFDEEDRNAVLPEGRVRRDMAAGQAEERARGERGEPGERGERSRREGTENTIVVQVRSDNEIKKVVKVAIDEDGMMKAYK